MDSVTLPVEVAVALTVFVARDPTEAKESRERKSKDRPLESVGLSP